MVNSGRPSMGCLSCKEGRVKCDLQRPSCRRCIRLKRSCPGYPDGWELVHRQQNEQASGNVQLRIEKRQRQRERNSGAVTSSALPSAAVPQSIPRAVDVSVEEPCVYLLYNDYCFNSSVGVFEALPFFASIRPSAPFLHALNAAALANASNRLNQYGLLVKAKRAYCVAVSALQRQIREPESMRNDSLLASVFLLGLFEVNTPLYFYCSIFVARTDPSSLDADFKNPWADWAGFPEVEPVIQQSVDLIGQLRPSLSSASPQVSTVNAAELIERTINVIGELGRVATLTAVEKGSVPEPRYFNGLLAADTQTSVAIAKSLYLAVRLHLTEMFLSRVGSFAFPVDFALESVVVGQICEQIRNVFELGGNLKHSAGEPGTALRVFFMSWPTLTVLQSSIASEETKSWVRDLL
ncbi:hypothetical protein BKA56DRAFT_490235 [Ilyonectria sp. MPI-CAGE-AT-0026]|nr:hypothetical protein BKA56DRAFT_490235 [Ilyonectria sp. MPI-CAGE-AT-0026]